MLKEIHFELTIFMIGSLELDRSFDYVTKTDSPFMMYILDSTVSQQCSEMDPLQRGGSIMCKEDMESKPIIVKLYYIQKQFGAVVKQQATRI